MAFALGVAGVSRLDAMGLAYQVVPARGLARVGSGPRNGTGRGSRLDGGFFR